jgi:shikimate dehydrogenase
MPAALQEIVCCMGQPVAGNPTQFMMEKAFAAAGLDWRYLTFEVPAGKLPDAMAGFRALGFRGGNFTIPHKVAVIPFLDALSPAAETMQAVNCVHRVDDRLIGENTDGKGFVQALRELGDFTGKRTAIVGAGGAARAIAIELALAGSGPLTIVNRAAERGQQLVELVKAKTPVAAAFTPLEGVWSVPDDVDLLVNATSVGLGDSDAELPIAADSLRPETIIADVVFNPPDTWLLRLARDRGCRTVDGLGMLVNQAVISFAIWTGQRPDEAVMRDALEEYLEI